MIIDANLRSKKFLLGHCYQVSKERILCLLPFSSFWILLLYLPSHSSCYRWLSVKHETVWLKKSFNWFLGGKKQLLPTSITSINTLGSLVFPWSDLHWGIRCDFYLKIINKVFQIHNMKSSEKGSVALLSHNTLKRSAKLESAKFTRRAWTP